MALQVWINRDNNITSTNNIFSNKGGRHVWYWDDAWYTKSQIEYLLSLSNPNILTLLNNKLIPPSLYSKHYNTSGCNISHIYQYNLIINKYKKAYELGDIMEIGAGYGNLCRCFFHSKFSNDYYLIDLPNQTQIQKCYLKKCNIDSKKLHFNKFNYDVDCFIAGLSLSEMPIDMRINILNNINANFIFIGFQHKFRGINNLHYFKKYTDNNNNYEWELQNWFGENNSVLIGIKKNN